MKKIFMVAPLCAFLTACGSTGGDSSANTPTTVPNAGTTATTTTTTTTPAKTATAQSAGPAHGVVLEKPTGTDSMTIKIGDKVFEDGKAVNLSYLGKGFFILPTEFEIKGQQGAEKVGLAGKGQIAVLQQAHSNAYFEFTREKSTDTNGTVKKTTFGDDIAKNKENRLGLATPTVAGDFTKELPKQGVVNYEGIAFAYPVQGAGFDKVSDFDAYTLAYTIDFAKKEGAGQLVSNANRTQKVALYKSNITTADGVSKINGKTNGFYEINIQGKETQYSSFGKGEYSLGLFGDQAQEITGTFTLTNEKLKTAETGIMSGTKK